MAALALMFLPVFLLEPLEKRGLHNVAFYICLVMFFASIYCLYAGIHLLVGWEDPFASADPAELGRAAAKTRRGGLVVLVIRFWPYVLIVAGAYFGYNTAGIMQRLRKEQAD